MTCSKKTPSEHARRRRGHALKPAVAKRRDGGREAVAEAVDRQHRARREVCGPRRRLPRAPRDDRRALSSAPRERVRASCPSKREAAERLRNRPRRPLGHAVLQRARQCRQAGRARPCGGAPRSSAPCFRATSGRASWRDRTVETATTSTCSGRETGVRAGTPRWSASESAPRACAGSTAPRSRRSEAGRPAAAPRPNRARPRCQVCSRCMRCAMEQDRQKNRYLTSEQP